MKMKIDWIGWMEKIKMTRRTKMQLGKGRLKEMVCLLRERLLRQTSPWQ